MTTTEAITALLEEYELATFEEIFRDEVKGDPSWEGLSGNHPKVQRFREIVETLRAEVGKAKVIER